MDTNTCCCNTFAFADRCPACQSGVHSRCVGDSDDCPNDATCRDPNCFCYDPHPDSLVSALHANL